MAMLFLTALLHAIVILGLTFTSSSHSSNDESPQLDVLLVTDEVPEAQSNEHAAYLSQRTQLGNGNTDTPSAARSPSSQGAADLRPSQNEGNGNERGEQGLEKSLLTSTDVNAEIRYVGAAAR